MTLLFSYCSDIFMSYKNDLLALLKNSFLHNSLDVKLSAIKTLAGWISVLDPQECKAYEELLPNML